MKNIEKYFIPFILLFLLGACSRSEDLATDIPSQPQEEPLEVNDFVWKGLNSWYYWQKEVPNLDDQLPDDQAAYANFINSKAPDELFYSLLYDYPQTDRFSWIVSNVDELLGQFNGVSKDSGMNFSLYYKDASGTKIVGIVNYVVPQSPADEAGVLRGDVFYQVNGQDITSDNYQQLLSEQFTITIADQVSVSSSGVAVSGVRLQPTITAVVLQENPVAYYKTFNQSGKKIGYLVYNGFKANYNDELNAAFAQMKTDGVTDLILDLRYNGGGSVETAVALGQMVTGQFTGSPYVTMEFNDKHSQYNEVENLLSQVNIYDYVGGETQLVRTEQVNSLGLNKVYILTGGGTASASELTIDGLRAYIEVSLIGETTIGKFMGSITLFDSPQSDYTDYTTKNPNHGWAMQPLVFAYFNGNHDAHPQPSSENPNGGLVPDIAISPIAYFGTLGAFGDPSADVGLETALSVITGNSSQRTVKSLSIPAQLKFFESKNTMLPLGTEVYLQNFTKAKTN